MWSERSSAFIYIYTRRERSSADVVGAVARCVGRPDSGREHLSMSTHGSSGSCSGPRLTMEVHMRCPRCKCEYTIGWDRRVKTFKAVKSQLAKDPEHCTQCAQPLCDGLWLESDLAVLELDMTQEEQDKEEAVFKKKVVVKGKRQKSSNKGKASSGRKVGVKGKKEVHMWCPRCKRECKISGFDKTMKTVKGQLAKDPEKCFKCVPQVKGKKQKKGNKNKTGIGNKKWIVKGKKEKKKIESGDENQSRWPPPEIISEEEARKMRIEAETFFDSCVEQYDEEEGTE